MAERFKIASAVYLVLRQDDQILLVKRANSGYMDGHYSLPAGHIDGGESALDAAIREADEEIGIQVQKEDLRHLLTMHRNSTDRVYIDLFFEVCSYKGIIKNNEPHKCQEIKFFSLESLPKQTVPYVQEALFCCENGISYLESGW